MMKDVPAKNRPLATTSSLTFLAYNRLCSHEASEKPWLEITFGEEASLRDAYISLQDAENNRHAKILHTQLLLNMGMSLMQMPEAWKPTYRSHINIGTIPQRRLNEAILKE